MVDVLARGRGAVVAGAANAHDLRVVDGVRRRPGHVVVAAFAEVGRVEVRQRVLARRADTVVAADAIAGDVDVVEVGWQPARGRVAVVAGVAGLDVVGVLARGCGSIVTGATQSHDLQMVDGYCRGPLDAVVAVSADVGRVDVRRVFAGGYSAIVTRTADANDFGMVDGVGGRPVEIVVTGLARVCRVQVGQRILARRADAIVAADAVVDDIGVVEIGRQPARGLVAIVAGVAGLDVVGVLARSDGPIVTGAAGAVHLQVIDGDHG